MIAANQALFFDDLGPRQVQADFSGGTLSSDGGVLLLRQADAGLGLTRHLAECFADGRQQLYVDHSVRQLVAQRTYGLALGYEDLNDHEWLRLDPLLAVACDKRDPLGEDRFNPAHRGVALAGASTLNRLELSNNKHTRAHKLTHDPRKVEACLLQMGVRCLPKHAERDRGGFGCDGTPAARDAGRAAFQAYYDDYCYLPLYVFVGDFPLWAQLRTSDKDGADGVVAALEQIVAGHSETLPACAHHCARGQRLLPGGNHGLVRGPGRRSIIVWAWPKTPCWWSVWDRRWRARKCAGACAARPACGSSRNWSIRPSRVGAARAG